MSSEYFSGSDHVEAELTTSPDGAGGPPSLPASNNSTGDPSVPGLSLPSDQAPYANSPFAGDGVPAAGGATDGGK